MSASSNDRTKVIDRARTLRRNQTSAEAKLWRVLRDRALNGLKFRRQVPIDRYVADFVCFEVKLVIEVDGATHSRHDEVARDAARTAMIEQSGFAVLRIFNADIYDNLEGVRETILAAAERRDTV
ncbi:endonuclease domain-containing protein [Methylobacterium sp. SI9]|uniref:endonuclease domain-containing protein n=1 Tax=Methylobacterium guangdongense TaxID=3138811 RepID=UPI00313C3E0B